VKTEVKEMSLYARIKFQTHSTYYDFAYYNLSILVNVIFLQGKLLEHTYGLFIKCKYVLQVVFLPRTIHLFTEQIRTMISSRHKI
jgi:hypothetical protein